MLSNSRLVMKYCGNLFVKALSFSNNLFFSMMKNFVGISLLFVFFMTSEPAGAFVDLRRRVSHLYDSVFKFLFSKGEPNNCNFLKPFCLSSAFRCRFIEHYLNKFHVIF